MWQEVKPARQAGLRSWRALQLGEECREPEHGFEQGRDVVNYSGEIYQLQPESEWGKMGGCCIS